MENEIIETEIWEENPEKKGWLRFVRTRKVADVFKDLEARMKERGMMPDEYFILSHKFEENAEMPRDASIYAYAVWGGNEGVYLDVEMKSEKGSVHFATGKTLGETEEDFDRMQEIAGFIYKSFAGFGRCAGKKEKAYVVCIDSSYIRDAQLFDSEGLSDEEFYESANGLDVERCWCDFGPNAFVDVIYADSHERACEIAQEKHGYDKRTLYAVEVKKK